MFEDHKDHILDDETEVAMKAMQEQDVNLLLNPLPNMGSHMILDFNKVSADLDDMEAIDTRLTNILECSNVKIEGKTRKKFEPQGVTICYLLSESHFSIHTWPEHGSCAIDFYHCGDEAMNNLNIAEEMLCDWLGWANCTQQLKINRGQRTGFLANDFPEKAEIFKNITYVHREKTPFQELRIYDTICEGRIMTLDGAVQFSTKINDNPEKDNYTVDLASVVKRDTHYDHIVIIGGGDLLIARYILDNFPKVKKLTVCDIDERVIECTKKYFGVGEKVDLNIASGRLEIIIGGGAEYMEKILKEGKEGMIGGVVVDCTDFVDSSINENSIAAELFTPKFYEAIFRLLQSGGSMSQNISHLCFTQGFIDRNTAGGFPKENIEFIKSLVPEYGGIGYCPLAISKKPLV